jgi:hypothetical protein
VISEYVADRIRRPPRDSAVVTGSTPVIAFGDPNTSRVATLGLNPSRAEFLSPAGKLLDTDRRFETLASLGVDTLADASEHQVFSVFEACRSYFQRNPYRRWFDQLERILAGVGASYYSGSACHLDLVQWATDPVWRRLSAQSIVGLMSEDVPFLRHQLMSSPIELVLLNGRRVLEEVQLALGSRLEMDGVPLLVGRTSTSLYTGTLPSGVPVVGWSINLQSNYGVTNELRMGLSERVAALASSK